MQYILSFLLIIILSACGSSDTTSTQNDIIHIQPTSTNTTTPSSTNIPPANEINSSKPIIEKTITIYVHGYSQSGYKREEIFGNDNYDPVIDEIVKATGFDTTTTYHDNSSNIIAITPYYGSKPPSYYTQEDIQKLQTMENGIPRYAYILAKYSKYIMDKTGAKKVNFLSVSMGSLVTRYLIEKDLEKLASDKKIAKWLSLEGVIKGNIAASGDRLITLAGDFAGDAPEIKQMQYSWIQNHLDANSSLYHDIRIGFESSTKDDASGGALSWWLRLNGNFEANDGVQAVKDTFFEGNYPHTFFYDNHYTLADNKAAWAYAATFLTSKKRVRITLTDVKIDDLHEDRLAFKKLLPAEIVFESSIHAPYAEQKWHFERAIDERLLRGGYLPLYHFYDTNTKSVNQILFDSYILDAQESLTLTLTPYELDMEPDYQVRELTGHGDHESLGTSTIMIAPKEGVYPLHGRDWSGWIKVEIF